MSRPPTDHISGCLQRRWMECHRGAVDRWRLDCLAVGSSRGRDVAVRRGGGRLGSGGRRGGRGRRPRCRRRRAPRSWRHTPAHERMAILLQAAELADERAEEIAQTISAEAGKRITEARGEASRSGALIRLAAFEGTQLYGDSPAAGRQSRHRLRQDRVHGPAAGRGRRRDHAVQLPGAAGAAQGRAGACGRERGRAEAGARRHR